VLEGIAGQLAPDGLLYLGGAETVLGITDRFAPVGPDHLVYELAAPRPAAAARRRVPSFA
jgi:chemotaxis protein methyltransferase CheR